MIGCVIGSFRKYYDDVLNAIGKFETMGHQILSPKHSRIIRDENGFVILESDDPSLSHVDIQTLVFHRAFRSDFVYVWDPNGYIGKTTAYEIGRITERNIPLYYKEFPKDIPLYIPDGSIIELDEFIDFISSCGSLPVLRQADSLSHRLILDLNNNIFHE